MIKESNNLPEHDNNYQVYLPNNLHSLLHLLCGSIHPSIKKEFKEAVGVKNIYLKMIGNEEKTVDLVSSTIIFDGMNNVVDSKNFHLHAENAYLDVLLNTNNLNLLNIGLSIEGDKCFENCRVFYQGTDKTIFKFEKIDASKIENTEYLEINTLPTKNQYKFLYGRIDS